jgi:hypothetical protein
MPAMRKLVFLVAAAAVLGLGPLTSRLGPVLGSGVLIALAIVLSCAASGTVCALGLVTGAAGAFSSGVLATVSSTVAGACLVGFAFAERTIRVRTPVAKAAHLGLAVIGGALAGTLSAAYASSSLALEGVAVVMGAVLVALPLLVDADDPIAYALEQSAALLRDPVARSLREGAALRRLTDDAPVAPDVRREVARTWKKLLKLVESRVRLERMHGTRGLSIGADAPTGPKSTREAVIGMLDDAIGEHVAALTRAYAAVDTAQAAATSLDDAAVRGVDAVGETLEEVSRAIMEVKA